MTVTITFEERRTDSGITFVLMRKTYALFGFKVWESVERANF